MFRKLLVANRGEIACRVIRTARRLGIPTVAVFSDADTDAMHVTMADSAIRIGPAAARHSYLDIASVLAAVRQTGAEAVHPGYGFLSENADFAEACAAAGVVFVGPPAAAIKAMGGKSQAKALMAEAGVPLVPGYHGEAQDLATLQAAAEEIGFPVLIKASAGGGGKGMRIVGTAAEFMPALEAAKREASNSFGDDRVLVERYLSRPRHIEIQVFADTHGNCVSLFERDCSIQRRHQKIIEEAPAPGMTSAMRRAMGDAAVAAARAVNYVGAGTVEFIVEDDAFHFMEMNTRLQVEHPVTEAVTGLDLVEWQLRVAAGEPLPVSQERLAIKGHAIEVRLYAEDPSRQFLPSVGRLAHLRFPVEARIDTGVREGDRIVPDYDPMIAKLIVHGRDRGEALARLSSALAQTEIVGIQTNLDLLRRIALHPGFVGATFDTGFIARHPEVVSGASAAPDIARAAAVVQVLRDRASAAVIRGDPHSPWAEQDSWRPNLSGAQNVVLREGDLTIEVAATHRRDGWLLAWEGVTRDVIMVEAQGSMLLRVDSLAARMNVIAQGDRRTVVLDGSNYVFQVIDPLSPPDAAADLAGRVMAPIPGRVSSLAVSVGDEVLRGQVLVVIEAMKMELPLVAPRNGRVSAVHCVVGAMVEEGVDLVDIDGTI